MVIAGVDVDSLSLSEAVDAIAGQAMGRGDSRFVVTPNAHHISMLRRSAEFRDVYRHAWLSLADGMPLVWASRLLGNRLPGRVNGTDLLVACCARAAELGLTVFFMGGRPGAADAAAEILQKAYPALQVAGTWCPPLGFETDNRNAEAIAAIRASSPDVLFVGLGAPKQELWLRRHLAQTGVPVGIGIGVSFELVGGLVPRAPRWMQRSGLEWLYRLIMEPARLWRRYLVTNPHFVWLVFLQWLHRHKPEAGAHTG